MRQVLLNPSHKLWAINFGCRGFSPPPRWLRCHQEPAFAVEGIKFNSFKLVTHVCLLPSGEGEVTMNQNQSQHYGPRSAGRAQEWLPASRTRYPSLAPRPVTGAASQEPVETSQRSGGSAARLKPAAQRIPASSPAVPRPPAHPPAEHLLLTDHANHPLRRRVKSAFCCANHTPSQATPYNFTNKLCYFGKKKYLFA